MKSKAIIKLLKQHRWPVVDWYETLVMIATRLPRALLDIEGNVLTVVAEPVHFRFWQEDTSYQIQAYIKEVNGPEPIAYSMLAHNDLALVRSISYLNKRLKREYAGFGHSQGPSSSFDHFTTQGWHGLQGAELFEDSWKTTLASVAAIEKITSDGLLDLLSLFDNVEAVGRIFHSWEKVQIGLATYNNSVAVYVDHGDDNPEVVLDRAQDLFFNSYGAVIDKLWDELHGDDLEDTVILSRIEEELDYYYTEMSPTEAVALLDQNNLLNQVEQED